MKTDWMAKSEGDLLIWADKFLPAVTGAATTLGWSGRAGEGRLCASVR